MLTIVNNIASKYVYCKVVYSACLIKIINKKKDFTVKKKVPNIFRERLKFSVQL